MFLDPWLSLGRLNYGIPYFVLIAAEIKIVLDHTVDNMALWLTRACGYVTHMFYAV